MIDYSRMIDASRNAPEHAASAPVFYETAKTKTRARSRRLTKRKKQASLTKARDRKSTNRRRRSTPGKAASMAKRRMSRKQRAAALKNLKKARSARRSKASRRGMRVRLHRKSPRRRRYMTGGGVKTKRRRRRKAKPEAEATPKRRRRKSGGKRKSAKRVAAGKKAARTRKRRHSRKGGAPKRRRRRSRKASAAPRRRRRRSRRSSPRRRRRSRKTGRAMSMRLPRRARKVYVVAAEKRRRRGRGRRRHGAMENPLSGVELFVGSLFGLTGFAIGDLTDRLIATHALTLKSAATTTTPALYADNPPTTGSYAGLFNPTAITSPMNLPRWANAVGAPALIFTVAHFVKSPVARSSMQFFAFGYGVRGVGKGIMDLMAKVTTSFGLGQRLYDGEMRAQVLKANSGSNQAAALANLPAAGLGQPARQLAVAPCANCGNCAKCKAAAAPSGVGWPSQPREITSQSTQTQPQAPVSATAPPRQPPPPPNAPPIRQQSFLTGAAAHPTYKKWGGYDL
jgi:hypothetical protein